MAINNLLKNKTHSERRRIKSLEISKLDHSGIFENTQYGLSIGIIGEVKKINVNSQDGIELFAKAWKDGKQLGFGKDHSVEIERFRFFNPPVLVDDPLGDIEREFIDPRDNSTKIRRLKEDPIKATQDSLSHIISIVGKVSKKIVKGKIGNTTSTFYPAAGTNGGSADGRFTRYTGDTSWSGVRDAADASAGEPNMTETAQALARNYKLVAVYNNYRTGFTFDTSAIADTDTIDSATFSWYDASAGSGAVVNDDTTSIQLVQFSPADTDSFVASDYTIGVEFGTTSLGSKALSAISADAYNDITINGTGLALISKVGVTGFGCITERDRANSEPTGNNLANTFFADETGTSKDPKLVVVHSATSVDYPMTAVQGSFTLTGITTIVKGARTMLAVYDTFVLTGQNVLFSLGHGIVAVFGSFVLSGQTVVTTSSRRMVAVYDTFVLTGQSITLKLIGTLRTIVGSFALTGFAATLTAHFRFIKEELPANSTTKEALLSTSFTKEPLDTS